MSAEPIHIDASRISATGSSAWDRITSWVSENKAVAYTIAGTVVVVTGAGAIYYFSNPKKGESPAPSEKKKSKKERRKEKKEAEEQAKVGISMTDEEARKNYLSNNAMNF